MINYYERYRLVDSFMRCEDRIFNLGKSTPNLLRLIIESLGVELPKDSKYFKNSDTIIVSTDDIVGKNYILYENVKYTLILLPTSIRSDDYNITEKIKALFNVLEEGKKTVTMYDLQVSLQPLLITTAILSDLYAPFDDLAEVIYNAVLSDILNDEDDIINMMKYINDNTSDEKFKIDLFSNSSIFAIISIELATKIIKSYNTSNT